MLITETVLSKTSLPELQCQWPQRILLPRIFYEQFNETESMSSTLSNSHDENETHQTSTLEPTNAVNLVRGRNQCLSITKIPHPSIHIQSPKPDFSRTQL
ncbi:unnamed protein product [Hymenolepis diminuta]|uniref:Uncharacterized protein n=1 Tax=Hymenolepis diminuta TaxID=6216 RepID=A0A564Y1Q9_HYMDI|nr:unnamed protein product [Hymenolepis diminuta]